MDGALNDAELNDFQVTFDLFPYKLNNCCYSLSCSIKLSMVDFVPLVLHSGLIMIPVTRLNVSMLRSSLPK